MPIQLGSAFGKIELDASGVKKSVGDSKQELTGLKGALSEVGLESLNVGRIMETAMGAVAGALVFSAKAAMEGEVALAKTNAVIKSTGGVAGYTADEIVAMSEKMSDLSGTSHDLIQSAENVMLTFTAIGKDKFPQAMQAALDLSMALGTDLQGSVIQVGKALQDPVLGLTALRRVGVNFNAASKDTVKAMMEMNDVAGAQQFILNELKREFGGVAEAMGNTTQGKVNRLKDSFDRLGEAIGNMNIAGRSSIKWIGDAADAGTQLLTWEAKMTELFRLHEQEVGKTAQTYKDYEKEIIRSAQLTGDLTVAGNTYNTSAVITDLQNGIAVEGYILLNDQLYTTSKNFTIASQAMWQAGKTGLDVRDEMAALEKAQHGVALSEDELMQSEETQAKAAKAAAQAEDDRAKALDNARNAAVNAKMDIYNVASSLSKEATNADITKAALTDLEARARGGGLTADQLSYAWRSAGLAAGLVTTQSLAMQRGIELANEQFASGAATPEQYTKALKLLPKAAADGVITLQELGLGIGDTLRKNKKDLLDETGSAIVESHSKMGRFVSDTMLTVANSARTTKGTIQDMLTWFNAIPSYKKVTIALEVTGGGAIPDVLPQPPTSPAQKTTNPSTAGDTYRTSGVTIMPGGMVINATPGMDVNALAEAVKQRLGGLVNEAVQAGTGYMGQ